MHPIEYGEGGCLQKDAEKQTNPARDTKKKLKTPINRRTDHPGLRRIRFGLVHVFLAVFL